MKCPRCQAENDAGARFCEDCGARLEAACPSCGTPVTPGKKFCRSCGAALTPEPAGRFASPESYTPKHLAEKILTSKSALEGERKLVTVLFCDIANSTGLAERLGPEGMHSLLNAYFELALTEVHRYEGTVNQFLGDGFMALFGAPLAHEDHARRAVLAALEIQRALRERRTDLGLLVGEDLVVRMGLNTGLVVVGKVGDNLRMDYTAVGDTTNLAARLQQCAEPGTILVSEATRRLARGYVRTEPLAPLQVKGRSEPLPVFRVTGVGTRRSPLEGREERALSQFVGRQRELAALHEAFAQVEAGQGQVIGVIAEPGVGKSRLVYEFRHSLNRNLATYLEGRCLSYGSAIPYVPVLDHVRQNCGIAETDSREGIAEKASYGLHEVGMDPGEWLPYLLHFLGLKEGTESLAPLSSETIRARTFELLRLLCLNGSRRRPLILAVEDLHWIDRTSEEYFASMVESLADAPILLLTTYRPGYRPPWIEKSYASQIALRPLSAQDSLSVVQSVLQQAPLPDSVAQVILSKAEGNPFFLEELTRVVIEHGLGRDLAVPDTVQGVLMARIDRLPEETKRVLQTASILGREFSLRLLTAIYGETGNLEPHLRELKRLEFLYERSGRGEAGSVFKHALTHDVAYESVLASRRQVLHGRAGQALETLYPERLEEYLELLAHHYGRSADTDKAFEYLDRANQKAGKANAMEEAKGYFDQAMTLLDALPDTEVNWRRRIALLVNQIMVFRMLFQFTEYHTLLTRYEPIAVRLGDPGLLGALYARLGYCEFAFGQLDQAIHTNRRAADLCEAAGNAEAAGQAYMIWEWSHLWRGDYEQVFALRDRTLRSTQRQFNLRWYTLALYGASWAHTCLGRWDEAVEHGQKGLRAGEEFSDNSVICYGAYTISCAYTSKGDLTRAIEYGELAVRKATTPSDRVWSQTFLAWAWCRAGEPRRGVEVLTQVVPITQAARFVPFATFHTLWLCEGYWLAGEYDKATQILDDLLEEAERCGMRFVIGSAHRLLGEIALTKDGEPTAATNFEKSTAILRAINAENELALAYAGYGRLHKRQGRIDEARDYLTSSLEIFERLGTLIEPDKLRAELAELSAI